MITVQLDSVYMKVPFKPLMKLKVQAYQQQFQTKMFRHSEYCSPLNEYFEIHRIGNLIKTENKEQKLLIVVLQSINGREQPCGRVQLRLRDIGRGLQMQRFVGCQDKEAAVTFTVQFQEVSNQMKESKSGDTSTTEESTVALNNEMSKETIRLLSNSLYKHKKESCATHLHQTYSKELDNLHNRYQRILGGLNEELEKERSASKRKECQLKSNHQDAVRLYKQRMQQLEQRVIELQRYVVEKTQQDAQTEYIVREECSISTEVTQKSECSTQIDESEQERIEMELRNTWQKTLRIPLISHSTSTSPSDLSSRKVTLTQMVSRTFENLNDELYRVREQLNLEKQTRQVLAVKLDELVSQYQQQLATQRYLVQQSRQDNEILRNAHVIELSRQQMEFQETIHSLQRQFNNYKKDVEDTQQERITELEESVREYLQALQFKVAEKGPDEASIKKVNLLDAQCQCDIVDDRKNKWLEEVLQDNAVLSNQVQMSTQEILQLQEGMEQLGRLAEQRLTSLNSMAHEQTRLEELLESLTFEHNCLLEVSSKLNEEKENLVRMLTRYEEQGKELYSFTKNIAKKKESRENTLDRIERSEKSRISRRSRITHRKGSGLVKPHPVLLIDGDAPIQVNAASNLTNNSNSSGYRGALLKVPKHHVGRTESMHFADQNNELAEHSSPSEARINFNAARTEFDEQSDEEEEEFDLSDDEHFNSDPIVQNEEPEMSDVDHEDHSPMSLMIRFKESLLAAHREIEQQKNEISQLVTDTAELKRKNGRLEQAVNSAENEVAYTRTSLESIIEELRKDLQSLQLEKNSLSTQCDQATLQKQVLKSEYKAQLEAIVYDYSEKQAALTEGFRTEVERLMMEKSELELKLSEDTYKLREEVEAGHEKIQILEDAMECLREEIDMKEDQYCTKNQQYQEQLERNLHVIDQLQQLLIDQHDELLQSSAVKQELQKKVTEYEQLTKGQQQVLEQKAMKIVELTERIEELQESPLATSRSEPEEAAVQTQQLPIVHEPVQQHFIYRPPSSRRLMKKDTLTKQEQLLPISELMEQYQILEEQLADKDALIEELSQKCIEFGTESVYTIAEKQEQLQASLLNIEKCEGQLKEMKQQLEELRAVNDKMNAEFEYLLDEKNTELQTLVEQFEGSQKLVEEQHCAELKQMVEQHQQHIAEHQKTYVSVNIEKLRFEHSSNSSKQQLAVLSEKYTSLEKEHKQAQNRMKILDKIINSFGNERSSYIKQAQQLFERTVSTLEEQYRRQLQFQLQRLKNKLVNESQSKKVSASQHYTMQSPNSSFGELLEQMGDDPILESTISETSEEAFHVREYRMKEMELNYQLEVLRKELQFSKVEIQAGRSAQMQLKREFRNKLAELVRQNIRVKNSLERLSQQEIRRKAQDELIKELTFLTEASATSR